MSSVIFFMTIDELPSRLFLSLIMVSPLAGEVAWLFSASFIISSEVVKGGCVFGKQLPNNSRLSSLIFPSSDMDASV